MVSPILEGIQLYNGMHRFMPTLVKLRGFRVREVPVKHSPRYAGKAKYGLWNRAFRASVDPRASAGKGARFVEPRPIAILGAPADGGSVLERTCAFW